MKPIIALAAICVLAFLLGAQSPGPQDAMLTHVWETNYSGVPSEQVVPNTTTTLITPISPLTYVRVYQVNFSASADATITFTSVTAACGGVCNLLPSTTTPLTIAAGTKYTINLNGEPAVGGVQWSSSVSGAVHGWVKGTR